MRLRLFATAVLTLVVASSLCAQTIDVFARATEATREGTTHVHGGQATVSLNSARGYEVGADLFWSQRISTELSIGRVDHELDASAFGETVDLGSSRVSPISAIVEFHTDPQGPFDIHAGAGASFVRFDDVQNSAELALLGVRSIKFHDKVAPVANAGASYRLGPRIALTADVKWFDIRTKSTATYLDGTSEGADLNLKQVTLGAGLSFRF